MSGDIPVAAELEREMRGMGNLTRAAYANQRMTLIGNTPLFFSAQGSVVNDSAVKEAKSDNIAGAGHLNDAPSGRGRLATRGVILLYLSLLMPAFMNQC